MTNESSWTAQHKAPLDSPPEFPGQVFTRDQLPDPTAQAPAGIDPQGWLAASPTSLFVEGDLALGLTADRTVPSAKPVGKKARA